MWWWWLVVEKGEAAVKVAATAAAAIDRAVACAVLDVLLSSQCCAVQPRPSPQPEKSSTSRGKSTYCHAAAPCIHSVYVPQFPPSFQLTLMVTSHFSLVAEHRTCNAEGRGFDPLKWLVTISNSDHTLWSSFCGQRFTQMPIFSSILTRSAVLTSF